MSRHHYWICVSGFILTSKNEQLWSVRSRKIPARSMTLADYGGNAKALTEENKAARISQPIIWLESHKKKKSMESPSRCDFLKRPSVICKILMLCGRMDWQKKKPSPTAMHVTSLLNEVVNTTNHRQREDLIFKLEGFLRGLTAQWTQNDMITVGDTSLFSFFTHFWRMFSCNLPSRLLWPHSPTSCGPWMWH